MIRTAIRTVVPGILTCIVAALCGIALLLAGARWVTASKFAGPIGGTGRTPGWYATEGFSGVEIEHDTGRQFIWTGQAAKLLFPHLDRSQAYHLSLRVCAGRPAEGPPPPQIRLFVDDVPAGRVDSSNSPESIAIDVPSRRADGASVALVMSNTFVPGAGDRRTLGVVIDDLTVTPASGHFRPSWYVVARTGLAILVCVAGVILCGFRSRLALLAAAAVTAGFVWLLLLDAAFIGPYVDRLLSIAIGVAIIGVVVAAARARWPAPGSLPEWSIAVGLVLGASALKLAFFTHPQIELRDAAFQVHRAEFVRSGRYFFTSVTPSPGFEFPYAIGLYVTAMPFWRFFPSLLDRAALLRGLAMSADALIGIAFYAAARRQWNDRMKALLCAALWPFARAPAMALGYANLTNLFAQGLFGVAMGVLAWTAAGRRTSKTALIAAGGLLLAAFLSHFSTLLVGVATLATFGVSLIWFGRAHVRSLGAWVLVTTLVAAAVSYGVYYSHFTAVYRKTIVRVASGQDAQATASMVAPPALKALRWITEDQFSNDYGVPGLPLFVAACAGAVLLTRQRRREGLTLLMASSALLWAGFSVLGIVSRVEMRTNLAAAPMFVVLAAYGLGALAPRSRAGAGVAAGLILAVVWSGLRVLLVAVGR